MSVLLRIVYIKSFSLNNYIYYNIIIRIYDNFIHKPKRILYYFVPMKF